MEVATMTGPILQMSHPLAHCYDLSHRLQSVGEVPGRLCLPSHVGFLNALQRTGWVEGKAASSHDGHCLFMEYFLRAMLLGYYLLSSFSMSGSVLRIVLTHLTLTATPSCRNDDRLRVTEAQQC